MASENEIKIIVEAEVKKAVKSLKQFEKTAEKSADKAKSKFQGFGKSLGGLKSIIGGIGFATLGKSIIGLASDFEQTQVSFETFLGSADKAKKVLKDLTKFSSATPFTATEVQQAGKALLAFGIGADELTDKLRQVGDLSAGTGKNFNELAVIFGKARVQGTLFAEDINQLTESGIPIIDEFAKQFGVSTSEVKKLGSEGKISFANLETAFESLTGEGGKFFELTAKQSETFAGKLSTLISNIQEFGKEIGGVITSSLKPLLSFFNEGSMLTQELTTNMGALAVATVGASFAFGPLVGAITAGVVATLELIRAFEKLKELKLEQRNLDVLFDVLLDTSKAGAKAGEAVAVLRAELESVRKIDAFAGFTPENLGDKNIAILEKRIKSLSATLEENSQNINRIASENKDLSEINNGLLENYVENEIAYKKAVENLNQALIARLQLQKRNRAEVDKFLSVADVEKRVKKINRLLSEGGRKGLSESTKVALEAKVSEIDRLLDLEELSNQEILDLKKVKAKLIADAEAGITANSLAESKKRKKQEKDNERERAKFILETAGQAIDGLANLTSSIFARQLQELEEQREIALESQNRFKDELNAIDEQERQNNILNIQQELERAKIAGDEEVAFQKENEIKKLKLQEDAKKREAEINAEFDEKIRQQKKRQAVADKASAVAQSLINTALSITSIYAQPPTAGGLISRSVQAGIIGGLGAVQTASILAQPIPRFLGGMDFVPRDRFPALLDEGERVLTKEENTNFNNSFDGNIVIQGVSNPEEFAGQLNDYLKSRGAVNVL